MNVLGDETYNYYVADELLGTQRQRDAENMEAFQQKAAQITPSIEKNGEGILTPDMEPYR